MYNNIDYILIFIFIIIYTLVVPYGFYKKSIRKSFKELDQKLSADKPLENKKALNYLLWGLNNKTNVDFAIYNSIYGRKWFLVSLILANVLFLLSSVFGIILVSYIGNPILLSACSLFLSFFLVLLILFIPDVYICSKKIKEIFSHNLLSRFMSKLYYYLYFSICPYVILFPLFLYIYIKSPQLNDLRLDFFLSGTSQFLFNTTVIYSEKPLDIISETSYLLQIFCLH